MSITNTDNLLQQSRLKNFPFLSVIKEVNNARNPTGIDYLNTLETKNIWKKCFTYEYLGSLFFHPCCLIIIFSLNIIIVVLHFWACYNNLFAHFDSHDLSCWGDKKKHTIVNKTICWGKKCLPVVNLLRGCVHNWHRVLNDAIALPDWCFYRNFVAVRSYSI